VVTSTSLQGEKNNEGKVTIRLLQDINDTWVGQDGITYGPYNKGQVLCLPEKESGVLISNKLAEKLDG